MSTPEHPLAPYFAQVLGVLGIDVQTRLRLMWSEMMAFELPCKPIFRTVSING